MPFFTDQLGRTHFLSHPPRRIVSLVPSQTELLHDLGLEESVVGITKFCTRPDSWFRTKSRVGGTKAVDPARVDALQPDLIIANKEENDKPQVEALAARYPVWVSDIKTLPDALEMILDIGDLTGKTTAATTMAETIASRFEALPQPTSAPPQAAYLIWRNPWMAAGGDTFINDMLRYCGFTNVFADTDRYPVIQLEQLTHPANLHVFLSSEPYPFRDRHIAEVREILPNASIRLVDGECFSWYGSRLLEAPNYFRNLIPAL